MIRRHIPLPRRRRHADMPDAATMMFRAPLVATAHSKQRQLRFATQDVEEERV